jgi:hypothetical protein
MKKKIAIVLDVKKYDWNGGINYYNNLINFFDIKKYQLFVIIGKKTIIDKKQFNKKFKFIKLGICDPFTINWLIRKIIYKIFNKDFLLLNFFTKEKFDFLTHSVSLGDQKEIKVVNWIPDLQPFLIKKKILKNEISKHYNQFYDYYKFSYKLIFSSKTESKKFFKIFKVNDKSKIYIFNNLPNIIKKKNIKSLDNITSKFKLKKNYFFIPNQFWKHKNHICLLKAIKLLKKKNIQFVFAGNLADYRNIDHLDFLKKFIYNNNIEKYVKILGNIAYQDVVNLIIHSKGLINPSNYEGWSTSVEEAKLYDIPIILSDIDTHKEQIKTSNLFFKKSNHNDLKNKILRCLKVRKNKFNYLKIKKYYIAKSKIMKSQVNEIYK